MFDKIKHAAKVLSTPAAPSAPQSTQTAREFSEQMLERGDQTYSIFEFAEAYASSRMASLQQELDRQKELAQVWTNLSTEWEGLIKKEKAKLSTLTGIARELAEQVGAALKFCGPNCTAPECEPARDALGKFAEWEKGGKLPQRRGRGEVVATYKVITSKGKRPPFAEVVQSVHKQLDDLGHDLRNAVIVAPNGATFRQVGMALRRIDQD